MTYTGEIRLSQPEGGTWMKPRDLVGHRVAVFRTHSIVEEPDPMNPGRMRTVAVVDYADLDDGQGGKVYRKAKVDKPGVVNKLSVTNENVVLGKMITGEAKAGQNPPFILDNYEPADAEHFRSQWVPAHLDEYQALMSQPMPGHGPAQPMAQTQTQTQVSPPQVTAPVPAPATPDFRATVASPSTPGSAQPAFSFPPMGGQSVPQSAPRPVPVATSQSAGAGGTGALTPEAMAALEGMIARGEIPGLAAPAASGNPGQEPPF